MKRTEVDIHAALEQPPQHLDNLVTAHVKVSRRSHRLGHGQRPLHRLAHALLKRAQLSALRDGVRDAELHHVVGPRKQRDHVVEDARVLDLRAVLEVELLGLVVVGIEGADDERPALLALCKVQVAQDVLFLVLGEVPEDDHAVGEDEHLGEVLGVRCEAVDGAEGPVVVWMAAVFGAVAGHRLERRWLCDTAGTSSVVLVIAVMMVPPFAALNLQIQDCLACAWRLQDRSAPHTVSLQP